jgi:transposase-like protein
MGTFLKSCDTVAISRRIFTREFKLAAIEEIESGKSLARVARELEVHENVLRRWKQEIQKNPSKAFSGNGNVRSTNREAELERKIGQMTLENDFLKKALQRVEEQRLLENAGGGRRSTRRSKKK